MDTEFFNNKEYSIPINIPKTTSHKYLEVIDKGYAKYLEIIHLCGNFIMYKQFYELIGQFEPELKKESAEKKAKCTIKRLIELGFIEKRNINMNKFIYLKKPALAITEGNYKCTCRVNLNSDLKNNKFQVAILKIEYLLTYGEIIHSSTMLNQLITITSHIYNTIIRQGNSYNYDTECIEEIIKLNNLQAIKKLVDSTTEYTCKLGIIRGLWSNLGAFYQKLLLQKQTISQKPIYYKLYVKKNGEIILHLIVNIFIFDVSHDKKYYKDKSQKLFYAFYNIHGNELRDVQKKYIKSNSLSMGYGGENHIGYMVTLIGSDIEVLNAKKVIMDESINSSVYSAMMGLCKLTALPISKYLLHSSRKKDIYAKNQERLIDNLILKQIYRINSADTKKVNDGEKLLDMLKGE